MGKIQSSKLCACFKNWCEDESGATALEYALMAALIALAIVASATALGDALNDNFNESSDALDAAMTRAKG